MKKLVVESFAFNVGFANQLVHDVPDDQLCVQPTGIPNHPAWCLGHLALSSESMIEMLGGEATKRDGWKELFDAGSKPVSDRGRYPDKVALLGALGSSHERLADLFLKATEDQLAEPTPHEQLSQFFPTVGNLAIFLMLSHEGTHFGQMLVWRGAQGYPKLF